MKHLPKILLLCAGLAFALLARGQEKLGIQVNPPITEIRANPGEIVQETIHITNRGEASLTLFQTTRDIKGTTEAGQPIFANFGEPTGFEMSSWIQLPENAEMFLEKGETKHIPIEVRVPENATPGGHFAGIFFTRKPEQQEKTGAGVGFSVGSILTFQVSGDIVEDARVRSFHTEKVLYRKPEIHFVTQVENNGNVLIRPQGIIEIWDIFGNEVAKIPANEKGGAVFPKGDRVFRETWNGKNISLGRYRAIISLIYGEEGRKTISNSTSFWIIPIHIIGGAVGVFILFLLAVMLFVRIYVRKKIQELEFLNEHVGGLHHGRTKRIEPKLLEKERRRERLFPRLLKTTLTMLAISFGIFLLLLLFI